MVGAVYIRRNKMITFEEVKEANKVWFSEGNVNDHLAKARGL